eukprot:1604930-Prymnesium_polylepis.2
MELLDVDCRACALRCCAPPPSCSVLWYPPPSPVLPPCYALCRPRCSLRMCRLASRVPRPPLHAGIAARRFGGSAVSVCCVFCRSLSPSCELAC